MSPLVLNTFTSAELEQAGLSGLDDLIILNNIPQLK